MAVKVIYLIKKEYRQVIIKRKLSISFLTREYGIEYLKLVGATNRS